MGGRRWTMAGMGGCAGIGLSPLLTIARDSVPGSLEGNKARNLWKKACRALARNASPLRWSFADLQPTLLGAERHLYAALISDLSALLPACESWEDYVWAHVQARMESAIEERRRELGGFWYDEEVAMGRDDGDETTGGLDEIFVNITKTGTTQARCVTANVASLLTKQDGGIGSLCRGAADDNTRTH